MEKGGKSKKEVKDEKQEIEKLLMKSLEEAPTVEAKLELLIRKYVEGEITTKSLRQEKKIESKKLDVVHREKENLQKEYNKSILIRDKLQDVCREQQKLIKSVKNESLARIREEEERRKESQVKLQISLAEITESLNHNNAENIKLREYNMDMTKKLKLLAEQYDNREKQLSQLNEQAILEAKLHEAKFNKFKAETAIETEILAREKQLAIEKLLETQNQMKEFAERELDLKCQLNTYTLKYDEFQKSLHKSAEVFESYKNDIDKMGKYTRKLEKEAFEWRLRFEKSNAKLIELATEKKQRDDHAERCNRQVDQLQKLLRALQHERTHLYNVLRENNIDCPALPALPPEPEPMKITSIDDNKDKLDIMTRNCEELKQTFVHLQSQLENLTTKEELVKSMKHIQEQPSKKPKKKKQKNKCKKNSECNNDNDNCTPVNDALESTNATPVTDVGDSEMIHNNEGEMVEKNEPTLNINGNEKENENENEKLIEIETDDQYISEEPKITEIIDNEDGSGSDKMGSEDFVLVPEETKDFKINENQTIEPLVPENDLFNDDQTVKTT